MSATLQNRAIVWSQPNCVYCSMAIMLLTGRRFLVEERKVGTTAWSKKDLLNAAPNARTVPQVFVNGTLVGGYQELKDYLSANP